MATNYTSIQITDGTTTADLTDGTNYSLSEGGWSPRVARLREAGVGGQSTHEDVVEEIRFSIFAASVTTALSKIATVQGLLDQARQFALGEAVTAVELQVEPQGTTSNEWRALILGGELILPDDWADNLVNKSIEDCVVRVVRRGVWLKTTYTPSASTSVNAGVVYTTSSTAVNAYSPMSYRMYDMPVAMGVHKPGTMVFTNAASKLQVYNSSAATLSGTTSTVAYTYALGGNVVNLGANGIASWTVSGFSSTARRIAIWASCSPAANLPFDVYITGYLTNSLQTRRVYTNSLPAGAPDYSGITFCGIFDWSSMYDKIKIARVSGNVEIDYICMAQIDDPNTHIVDLETPQWQDLPAASSNLGVGVENSPLTRLSPLAYFDDNTVNNKMAVSPLGDTYLTTNGTQHFAWLAQGQNVEWRPWNTTGPALAAVKVAPSYIQASVTLT